MASRLAQRGRATARSSPTLRFDAVGVVVDADDRLVALDHLEGAF